MFTSSDSDNVSTTQQMIMIEHPYKDEIQNLVNYLRIYNGMKIDWMNFDENIDELVKISKEKNIFLKAFSEGLQKLNSFSKNDIYKLFDIKDEKKGLEKLEELNGLDYLTFEIEKLVKYANSKKIVLPKTDSDEVKRIIPQAKAHKNEVNLHIALSGNPGTGKTTVAKIISEVFKEEGILEVGHIVKVTRDDLVAEHIGGTAIQTKEKINQAMGGVLFIDEVYALAEGGDNDFGKEAINTILEAMSDRKGEFSVIIAGYPNKMKNYFEVNEGMESRFAKHIYVRDYEPEVLIEIFENKMLKENRSFDDELKDIFPHFIRNWFNARDEQTFGNARAVLKLFDSMDENAYSEDRKILQVSDIPESFESGDKDNKHTYKMRDFLKKQSDDVMADALAKLDDIVGLDSVKENIKSIIETIEYERDIGGNEKIIPGHYVFQGNTGTGKTTVAEIFAIIMKELKITRKGTFKKTTLTKLKGTHVGEAEKNTEEIILSALGGVLFIDEAHNLADGGEKDYGKKVIATLVEHLDEKRNDLIVILAGYSEKMGKLFDQDEGLKSRFPNIITLEDYTNEELLKIFHVFNKQGNNYQLNNDVENKLLKIFQQKKESTKKFANAREVRNIYDSIKPRIAKRYKRDHLAKDDILAKTILLEDLD